MPADPLEAIAADLAALEGDPSLRAEERFRARAEALDLLEVHIFDRLATLNALPADPAVREIHERLRRRAEGLRETLEGVDTRLFRRLREEIRRGAGLRELIRRHVGPGPDPAGSGGRIGFDALDLFLDGILGVEEPPAEALPREPGMVSFQKTPARIVLELAERAAPGRDDVFFDVGSGLGQVPILFHLLTGAAAVGIEREPAFCARARACAAALGLSRVEFREADARAADYSGGIRFFLYTPVRGPMLGEVLDRILSAAFPRALVFTFGPCTAEAARHPGLRRLDAHGEDSHRLAFFAPAAGGEEPGGTTNPVGHPRD